jgi:hypothetical protein
MVQTAQLKLCPDTNFQRGSTAAVPFRHPHRSGEICSRGFDLDLQLQRQHEHNATSGVIAAKIATFYGSAVDIPFGIDDYP